MKSLLPDHFTQGQCLKVAKALMHTTPQFFIPISYSEKSLIHNTIYDSPDEVYTFEDDVGEDEYPTGVYTALLPCYVRGCERGGGGCYAPRCPNRTNRGGVLIIVNDTAFEVSIVKLFLYESDSINRTEFFRLATLWMQKSRAQLFIMLKIHLRLVKAKHRKRKIL